MKKRIVLLCIVTIVAMISIAFAETQTERTSINYTGVWVDPNYGREVVILPQNVCWKDDLMGEEAVEDGFMMNVAWASSSSVMWNYHMTGTIDAKGNLQYNNGFAENYTYSGDGELDIEETGILEENGTGMFTLGADDTLTWQDSFVDEAGKMVFRREKTPPISAEELTRNILMPVINLETGTAGSSLKQVELIRDFFSFCSMNLLWNMDENVFEKAVQGAIAKLNESDRILFREKMKEIVDELERLLREDEKLGDIYVDADVNEQMTELRADPSVRLSVKVLTEKLKVL